MNTDSMFSALVPVLSDIPHIRATNISIEMLARLISRETHGHVFNETMDEIMTWTMGGKLYHMSRWGRRVLLE